MADKTVGQLTQTTTIVNGDLLVVWPAAGPGPLKSIDYSVLFSNLNTGLGLNFLAKASNLSDLASPASARANLGLGDSALRNVGQVAGTVAAGDDPRFGLVSQPIVGPLTVTGAITGASFVASTGNALAFDGNNALIRRNGNLISFDYSVASGHRTTLDLVTGTYALATNGALKWFVDLSGNMAAIQALLPFYDGSGNYTINQTGAAPNRLRVLQFNPNRAFLWNETSDDVQIINNTSVLTLRNNGQVEITAPGGFYVNGVLMNVP